MSKWNEKEVWSDIIGFPDYMVSTQGNVLSNLSNKILKPQDNGNGYKKIGLSKEGKVYQRYIHRLVAQHFVASDVNCNEVDHINRDKSDNRADNLRWVNRGENSKNMCRENRKGYKLNQLSKEQIIEIQQLFKSGLSNVEISKKIGVPRQTIYHHTRALKEIK